MTPEPDYVDAIMASWAESRPDLDVRPMAVTTRLSRVRDHLEGEMAAVLGAFGLTAPTFVLIATLARLGGSTAEARVASELGLTQPTVAARLDRLIADGLVERGEDDTVTFTQAGRRLVDEVVPAHLDNQARVLSGLTASEQDELAGLLRKLLAGLESAI